MQILKPLWYSFPVQLLVLHLRRHLFLLGVFLVLGMFVTKFLLSNYGFAYLFLDPEYMGKVSVVSFYMLGLAFGGFTVLWNITSYILFSHKFPFLATFRKPFFRYCLNNFVIPLAFGFVYLYCMVRFQYSLQLKSPAEIVWYVLGFSLGAATGFLVTLSRSLNTHRKEFEDEDDIKPDTRPKPIRMQRSALQPWKFSGEEEVMVYRHPVVEYALMYPWKVRRVRKVEHYKRNLLIAVFRQHQKNALILELIALELVVLMGFLMDSTWFRLPTGVSFFLLFSILIAPIGAFAYWLRTWAVSVFIVLFLLYNFLATFNIFTHRNQAFGLSYDEPYKEYSLKTISESSTKALVTNDSLLTIEMLNRWKAKMDAMFPGERKHKMAFVNSSGGGLRSAVWSFYMLQQLDSISDKTFLDHAQLMTGASGGTLGQAYFRELFRQRKSNSNLELHSRYYLENVSKDLLNAVSFALVVNDLFVPWQKFKVGDNTYTKDRAYLWEKQLNENTGFALKKRIGDYSRDEAAANIPLMIFTPTITDDARRLVISNFPMSYMCRPELNAANFPLRYDGVDACNFFGTDNARSLLFTSAIRMNATFPYIMPNVYLPTNPSVQVMDAGMRDNYGTETTLRFVYTFREWINENTSGLVIVQTRDEKNMEPAVTTNPTFMKRRIDPLFSILYSWMDYQDFRNDAQLSTMQSWITSGVDLVTFEYIPASVNSAASMSWHLTEREKADILQAVNSPYNQNQLIRFKRVMGYK